MSKVNRTNFLFSVFRRYCGCFLGHGPYLSRRKILCIKSACEAVKRLARVQVPGRTRQTNVRTFSFCQTSRFVYTDHPAFDSFRGRNKALTFTMVLAVSFLVNNCTFLEVFRRIL